MSMQWTAAQRDAITRTGGQVLVSAAAGSGKTAVLVQRIIELITRPVDPVDADRLLVVTFTNAAAAEMSAKVKTALEKEIAAQPTNAALRRQALLLGRAQISTVHAFCMALLRDHFADLGIPVDFTVADEVVSVSLRRQALERTMDMLYADPASDIRALSDLFGRARSDRDTARLVEKLYDFEANLAFPQRWEQQALSEIESRRPLAQTAVGGYLFGYAAELLQTARDMLSEAMELCSEDEVLQGNYAPALAEDFHHANRLLTLVQAMDWDGCVAAAQTYTPQKLGGKRGADPDLRDAAKELRDAAKKIFVDRLAQGCFICTQQQYLDNLDRMQVPQQALFAAVRLFGQNLSELKLERRIFDFSDLERYAIQLLCQEDGTPTPAAQAEAARFDYILVDEYQDTNEIQDLIFRSVSRQGKNLFFVGDVKQSIYSFRRADPDIFIALRDRCHDSDTGLFPARIPLAHNFRSSSTVIDAVNSVFAPIMTRALGGTDYSDTGEQLLAGLSEPSPDPVGMEVCLVQKQTAESEPAYIARRIADMLRAGYPVADGGDMRRCRASDFCILLRSAKDRAQEYVRALEAEGVRCTSDGGDDLFARSEVAVVLALLRVIDNPRRDLDLAAVMLSPLFGFSPDDLAALRLVDRKAPLCTLLAQSDDARIVAFMETLTRLRRQRGAAPVGELVQTVIDALDAEIALCAGDGFAARRDNLRLLIDHADRFSKSGGTLSGFLRMCDAAAQHGGAVRREFSAPPDAVCITTVHKAKGLEWPVVIVANTDKLFNTGDSRDPVMLFDTALGCGARLRTEIADGTAVYAHRTLPYAALALKSRQKTDSEEMRVLYVALTRARQKLLVTAALPDPEKTLAGWRARSMRAVGRTAALSSRWIDWVGLSQLGAHAEFAELQPGGERTAGAVCLTMSLPVSAPPETDIPAPTARPDAATVAAINRRAAFAYPDAALFHVPSKLAVTDLAKDKGIQRLYKPAFARDGVSATERGSAIHLFMQCADYAAAAVSVENELQRLVGAEYIDPVLAEGISKPKLKAFFGSELGRRVAGSDVLREYAFIDAVDAGDIAALPPQLAGRKVMVQGIADCIVLDPDGAILIDYKSDCVRDAAQLVTRYSAQLSLYKKALDRRLPVPVKQCLIYSFELGEAIEVDTSSTPEFRPSSPQ